MISVLCPTRRRWDCSPSPWLAGIPPHRGGTAEYLVAHDPDDLPPYPPPPHARFWEAPQRYGYQRLHEYYNALAARAQGNWLFIWNDDARLVSEGWDEVIEAQAPAFLLPGHDGPPHCNPFPVWPRRVDRGCSVTSASTPTPTRGCSTSPKPSARSGNPGAAHPHDTR